MTAVAAAERAAEHPQPTPRGNDDARVISLVAIAHFTSHIMQMALPPLLPVLHRYFGASYTELGLLVTCYFVTSGFGQALAGILVDRYGAPRLLVGGMVVASTGIALAGMAPSLLTMMPLALLAGLGNSVFHPADLSIISHRVSERLLGRAYASHAVAGQIGFAASPVLVAAVASFASWRVALVGLGIVGLAISAVVYASRAHIAYARTANEPGRARRGGYFRVIGSPIIIMAFAYFILTAFAGSGVQAFSVSALTVGYGIDLAGATLALTLFLTASAVGIVAGGFLADRTDNHQRVAITGVLLAALMMAAVAILRVRPDMLAALMAVGGLCYGITAPSRDVLVRRAAGSVGMGSVFGFVYSGFDLGSSTAPLLFGALLDRHAAHGVFLGVAIAFALAAPAVLQVRTRPAAAGG